MAMKRRWTSRRSYYSLGIELMENSTELISREIYISAGNQQHEMGGSRWVFPMMVKAMFVSLPFPSRDISRHPWSRETFHFDRNLRDG